MRRGWHSRVAVYIQRRLVGWQLDVTPTGARMRREFFNNNNNTKEEDKQEQ